MGDPVILYNRVPHPPRYRNSTFRQLSLKSNPYTLRWVHLPTYPPTLAIRSSARGPGYVPWLSPGYGFLSHKYKYFNISHIFVGDFGVFILNG